MKLMFRYAMITMAALLCFGTIACEKVDKAFEAVDKAKNLKTDLEKKADELKKDVTGKAEELTDKVKKGADNLAGSSGKENKGLENKGKSEKEEKEKGKNGRERKDEED